MNIIEAIKKALQENKAITNPDDLEGGLAFLPTNSDCFGIVLMPTEPILDRKDGISTEVWQAPGRFWNPRAADLLREDWELV
ncbi:hypothetical protein RR45_GL000723 [Lactococcus chungangensis CAU 28 = DSM 22330]|uniref:DUF2829 domain-containing protein n=1 Tax=Pseudolactococcus chungangensis CAU 28 = DSM 22330 TaxID=1122154 RepID=A0A1K2H8F3_9LACT|nr:hypothetical protein [Lactococcus chungangensis]PCS02015.1 hypothetical protein RR45_GL000723 [Lactococcus chungangensis CAU 28 = DSM 22330]SFZ72990.1 hypothetical protein SAMN02746068_00715 [Lactococcus chungangensis CAU 28 = DSM 22330]